MTCKNYLCFKEFTVNLLLRAHFNFSSRISGNLSCLLSMDLHRPKAHQIFDIHSSKLELLFAHSTPPLVNYYTLNPDVTRCDINSYGKTDSTVAVACCFSCRVSPSTSTKNNYCTTTANFRLSLTPNLKNFSLQKDKKRI